MRQVIFKINMSTDGFVARPDGDAAWMFKSSDEVSREWALDLIRAAGVHVMGRGTYDSMAAYWPTATDPFAAPMNEIPKVEARSSSTAAPGWRAR
jgi:dihydrofolate reductase